MTTTTTGSSTVDDDRRANPLGAYITTLGALITLISVWLDWVTLGPGDSEGNASSGYEADSLVPFIGYLAIAFAIALLYAAVRADRRQHRGLSLASMAVGLASFLWALSFLFDPIETVKYQENVSTEIGVWIALIGTLLWTIGSFLLAKEPEGDFETRTTAYDTTDTVRSTTPSYTSTHQLDSDDVRSTPGSTSSLGSTVETDTRYTSDANRIDPDETGRSGGATEYR